LHPKDLVDMAHSPAYFTAAGAADRDFSWANATAAKIADPVIHSLIDKVRVGLPPTENAERYRQGATVTIALRDGRSFTSTVYAPKGSGQLGIAWNDIDAKFRALAPLGGLGGAAISRTLDIIHDFRRAAGVSPLLDLLRPAN
jgi:2-methylcitrate dehydratase PrpD